jgi:hypothetical protein
MLGPGAVVRCRQPKKVERCRGLCRERAMAAREARRVQRPLVFAQQVTLSLTRSLQQVLG